MFWVPNLENQYIETTSRKTQTAKIRIPVEVFLYWLHQYGKLLPTLVVLNKYALKLYILIALNVLNRFLKAGEENHKLNDSPIVTNFDQSQLAVNPHRSKWQMNLLTTSPFFCHYHPESLKWLHVIDKN